MPLKMLWSKGRPLCNGKSPWRLGVAVAMVIFALLSTAISGAVEAPRNPNSAKECALCHYRWIDTFFVDGRGSDLVEYQPNPVVATEGICFSCHDGSVVDSRSRVYNDHRHQINKPPPPGMTIPAVFPLDKQGRMQCATCHTAHGVSSEMGMEKTIFLRSSNKNSAMCLMCHSDKGGGPAAGNHPINTSKIPIPQALRKLGAQEGESKDQLICETCHMVHGSQNERFLIESALDSGLCVDCHTDKADLIGSKHDLSKVAPHALNNKGQPAAQSGACGACHLVHGGKNIALWGRELPAGKGNPAALLCVSCHTATGLAGKKVIDGHSHPVDVNPAGKRLATTLPLFGKGGDVAPGGVMSCPTCHDPHRWNPVRKEPGGGLKVEGDSRNSFLRLENSPRPKLCGNCHVAQAPVAGSDHDLTRTAPEAINTAGQKTEESGVCGACHLVHGGKQSLLWARDAKGRSRSLSQALCETCHSKGEPGGKKLIRQHSHPVNIAPTEKGLTTSLPLYRKNGELVEGGLMTCSTCHDPHQWDPLRPNGREESSGEGDSRNSFLRLENSPAPVLCVNCHKEQGNVVRTDHDLLISAPEAKNSQEQTVSQSGVCGSCHLVHNARKPARLWAQGSARGDGVVDKMCNSCHSGNGAGKNKIPQTATHPQDKLVNNIGLNVKGKPGYFPLFDKETGEPVTTGDISCASCHDVHQWDPNHPEPGPGINVEGLATNSFLRANASMLCMDCHGLDALFRFKYYHDVDNRGVRNR